MIKKPNQRGYAMLIGIVIVLAIIIVLFTIKQKTLQPVLAPGLDQSDKNINLQLDQIQKGVDKSNKQIKEILNK